MKMRTLRKLRTQAPRVIGRVAGRRGHGSREFDISDATMEPEAAPAPEAVFDRITGPYGRRSAIAFPGSFDEET